MRKLIMLALLAAGTAALVALPAAAKPRGTNGKIVVNIDNAVTGQEQVYTINPDGTDLQFLANDQEAGQWSPDGTKIAMFGGYLDFDTGDITDLGLPFDRYPDLALFCGVWSPNGARLACEGFGQTDGSLNGVYTIRSSDGGDLQRVTTAEFDDCPADYSPNGKRLLVSRGPLVVVKSDGSGLRQITPSGIRYDFCSGSWSPQGNEILFSAHVPDTDRSTIWTVHSDGSGLRKIPVLGCGGSGLRSDLHRLPEAGLVSGRPEDHVRAPLPDSERPLRPLHRQCGRKRSVPGHEHARSQRGRRRLGHAPGYAVRHVTLAARRDGPAAPPTTHPAP